MDDMPTGQEVAFGTGELLLLALYAVLVVIPFWRIYGRAGFSPWLSLLMLIPLVNVLVLYYVAFARWPRAEHAG